MIRLNRSILRRLSLYPVAALALAGWVAGCASAPDPKDADAVQDYIEANDPAEPTMRIVFAFNQALDTVIVKPLAEGYLKLPEQVRTSIHNFLQNLRTPVVLVNDVLQGNGERAGTTVARVVLNTTLGVGGLFDPATAAGYPRHSEDFGQTLAVWGVDEGPYIVWPILGPSNPRDTVGFTVDFFTDPLNVWTSFAEYGSLVYYGRTGVTMVDARALNYDEFEDLQKGSIDFYVAIRNFYRQRRDSDIRNEDIEGAAPAPSPDTGPRVR